MRVAAAAASMLCRADEENPLFFLYKNEVSAPQLPGGV